MDDGQDKELLLSFGTDKGFLESLFALIFIYTMSHAISNG